MNIWECPQSKLAIHRVRVLEYLIWQRCQIFVHHTKYWETTNSIWEHYEILGAGCQLWRAFSNEHELHEYIGSGLWNQLRTLWNIRAPHHYIGSDLRINWEPSEIFGAGYEILAAGCKSFETDHMAYVLPFARVCQLDRSSNIQHVLYGGILRICVMHNIRYNRLGKHCFIKLSIFPRKLVT